MRKLQSNPSLPERNLIREFTDREAPQEAFERKFQAFYHDWREVTCTLSFYGIGGVGKTSLINKLCRVIRGLEGHDRLILDAINCSYFVYDFESEKANFDKLSILFQFRKQLKSIDPAFLFHHFDSAVLLYAKKTGRNLDLDQKVDSLLESNPWLNGFVKMAGFIPGMSWIPSAVEAFDKVDSIYTDFSEQYSNKKLYQDHLQEIDMLEASELLDKLHSYFISDMNHNMRYIAKEPIVVFLDAYEKYIDNNNKDSYMITVDHWLRKGIGHGVMRSIPGILWVVAGRDRLDWSDDDWEEILPERPFDELSEEEKRALAESELEQHLLGDLSFPDAVSYMRKAGLTASSLHKPLYDLSRGTPLYLYVCINTYLSLQAQGRVPTVTDFGSNLEELVSRYLNCMSDAHREIALFLACLGKWTDESVKEIASKASFLRFFSEKKYIQFLKHSFIIKNLDGYYTMHGVVRDVCLLESDKAFLENVTQLHLDYMKSISEKSSVLDSVPLLYEYVLTLSDSIDFCTYDTFLSHLIATRDDICNLEITGNYDLLYKTSFQLYKCASSRYPNTAAEWITCGEYGRALRLMNQADIALGIISKIPLDSLSKTLDLRTLLGVKNDIASVLEANSQFEKALRLREEVLSDCLNLYDESHIFTAKAMLNLSYDYLHTGDNQKAILYVEKSKQILDALPVDHPMEILAAKGRLSNYYYNSGNKQRALELRLEVFEERKSLFSINNPKTIIAMKRLADSYEDMEEYALALPLREDILKFYWNTFGDGHPKTMSAISDLDYLFSIYGAEDRKCIMYEQLLQIRKDTLGEGDPNTLSTMKTLADTYAFVAEDELSYELLEQLIQLRCKYLGDTHPDTISLVKELSAIYTVIGREEKASAYYALLNELQKESSTDSI